MKNNGADTETGFPKNLIVQPFGLTSPFRQPESSSDFDSLYKN